MTSSATFSVKPMKRVSVVEVAGRIDSSNARDFDETLEEAMEEGYQLVLDLSGVDYMSSAALRAMVSALRTCKKNSGDVRIANPSERVSEVLSLAGLESVFQVYADQVSAVGSF